MSFFKAKKGAGVASKEEMRHRREVKKKNIQQTTNKQSTITNAIKTKKMRHRRELNKV